MNGQLGRVVAFCSIIKGLCSFLDFPSGLGGKASAYNVGDPGSIPGLERSPGEGNGNPVFLPGEYHGWRRLISYSPWDRKESDTTEQLHFFTSCSFLPFDSTMPLGIVLILGSSEVLSMSTFQLRRHENGINSDQVSEGNVRAKLYALFSLTFSGKEMCHDIYSKGGGVKLCATMCPQRREK